VRRERCGDAVEQRLERDDVVQRLVGDHGVVTDGRPPAVQVDGRNRDVVRHAGCRGLRAPALQYGAIDVQAFDDECRTVQLRQRHREADFDVAVAGAYAQETARFCGAVAAAAIEVFEEEGFGVRRAERLQLGTQVAVRPVVVDVRKRVDRRAPAEAQAFGQRPEAVVEVARGVAQASQGAYATIGTENGSGHWMPNGR